MNKIIKIICINTELVLSKYTVYPYFAPQKFGPKRAYYTWQNTVCHLNMGRFLYISYISMKSSSIKSTRVLIFMCILFPLQRNKSKIPRVLSSNYCKVHQIIDTLATGRVGLWLSGMWEFRCWNHSHPKETGIHQALWHRPEPWMSWPLGKSGGPLPWEAGLAMEVNQSGSC